MPYISESSIQEVKDRVDAIAVVSEYVKLEKRGGRWWGCCPFHQEKTGSFTVNPEIKTYYCFGCHKGGTVINFAMEMDKISFPEAIELFAKKAGMALVYDSAAGGNFSAADEARKKEKEGLFELYQRMSGTFHHFLMKTPEAEAAKRYIMARGISIEFVERFRLGYAPADRYWLHKFLLQKGYSREFLGSSGLFSSRYPEVSLFSGRLMFPIADRQGRTVAFGGRFLPAPGNQSAVGGGGHAEPPKYINSPELEIYKKGETLFAADFALPEIRRTKTAYIAEGYMDVMALHQAGIGNAVAPLGTAFTDEQAKLLRRWADRIILFFDDDEAGQAAAVKAIFACRKNDLACAVVKPQAAGGGEGSAQPKDPADILQRLGAQVLQETAKYFINDVDFLIARAKSLYAGNQPSAQGKARAVAFLFPYMDILGSDVARSSCVEAVADAFGLLPAAVAQDYRRHVSGQPPLKRAADDRGKEEAHSRIRMNDELALFIAAAVNHASPQKEKLFPKFRTDVQISEIEDNNAKEIFIALEECIRRGEIGMDDLLSRIPSPALREFIVERSASGEFSVNPQQLMADGIRKIKGRRLERQQEEIIIKLRELKKE
ncbi:MAG: DNA primase, partial [Treponema sp.]|nr:DNA primase [Treponema sp.]